MQPTNWREERRRDRMADAQIGRDNQTARGQARLAESDVRHRQQRDERQARRTERRTARKQRAARRADLMTWLRAHVTGLLFVPVITVPGVLAWTAMAAYGAQVFGPAGVTLPAFSEGAMWAFAGATTITRHRHPQRPVWHLRLGTVIFASEGAALNFIHGLTPAQGALRGLGTGVVMALISVAGVVAHQLITAGPRQSCAERAAARNARAAARRERAIGRAALRHAAAVLDADGTARLVHEPATVMPSRHWGRVRLANVPNQPGQPVADVAPETHLWPRPAPALKSLVARQPDAEPEAVLTHAATAGLASSATRQESAKPRSASAPNRAPKPAATARQKDSSSPSAKRAKAEELLRANPSMSRAEVVEQTGVSPRTADRIRDKIPRRLHVAGG
jgi:hypothetical protein